MVNKKYIFIFGFSLFLIGLVLAAPNAPTSLILNENTTSVYDEGSFFVNWTSGAGDTEANYSIYVFSNNTLYLKADNNSATGYSFSNTTEANYTFIIEAVNATGTGVNSTTNISIYVDLTIPIVTLPEYTNATVKKNTDNLTLNISVSDSLSGLTGSVCLVDVNGTNQSISVSSGWCNSSSISLTGLSDGNQTIKVYVNDTVNNLALNNSYVVSMDTTVPTVSLALSSVERDSVILSISTTGTSCTSDRGAVSGLTLTDTTVDCGNYYTYVVTCLDGAGNSASATSSQYTLGCGGGTPSFWGTTFVIDEDQFTSGIIRDLAIKNRMKIRVANEYHYVGVLELTETTARVEISSIPQEAMLNVGESKKFDVTGDGYYDILVTLNSISSNKANIKILSIYEKMEPLAIAEETKDISDTPVEEPKEDKTTPLTGEVVGEESIEEKSNLTWLWVILSILIIVVVLYLLKDKIWKKVKE